MKKLIVLIMMMAITWPLMSQTDDTIDNLPAENSPAGASTEYLYLLDGAIDKHLTLEILFGVIGDSTAIVKTMLGDSIAAVKAIIGGNSGWTLSGDVLYLSSNDDSVGIGILVPTERLEINGNAVADTFKANYAVRFASDDIVIYRSGDDMVFKDGNNTAVTLTGLIGGGNSLFTTSGTTNFSTDATDHWHFGANTTTTYVVKVTGNMNVTTDLVVDDQLSIGMEPYGSTYDLSVYRNVYFNDDIVLPEGTLMIWTGGYYIRAYDDDFVFLSPDAGSVTLSELAAGGTGEFSDTIFTTYLSGGDELYWLVGHGATGSIDSAEVRLAYFVLKMKEHLTARERLADTLNGEIGWLWSTDSLEITENGDTIIHKVIHKTYGVHLIDDPMGVIQALTGAIEYGVINTAALEDQVEILEGDILLMQQEMDAKDRRIMVIMIIFIVFVLVNLAYLQYYVYKQKRKSHILLKGGK